MTGTTRKDERRTELGHGQLRLTATGGKVKWDVKGRGSGSRPPGETVRSSGGRAACRRASSEAEATDLGERARRLYGAVERVGSQYAHRGHARWLEGGRGRELGWGETHTLGEARCEGGAGGNSGGAAGLGSPG